MLLYDVIVVGAGPVGMTAAAALAHAGFSVALIDRQARSVNASSQESSSPTKWFALGHDVLSWMATWGWHFSYQPLKTIQLSCHDPVADTMSPESIVLQACDVPVSALAGVISQHDLHRAMHSTLNSRIDVYAPDEIKVWHNQGDSWRVQLASGVWLTTLAIIGADGKQSNTRQHINPLHVSYTFPQTATVFQASGIPEGWAYEHFFPHGSLALLSTHSLHGVGHGVGIWIHDQPLTDTSLLQRFSPIPITPTSTWSYFPVHGLWTEKPSLSRCVLVGDAAHIIHPIAGQGLNLGLRHVKSVVDLMTQRHAMGLDWGLGWHDMHLQWATQALSLHMGTTAVYGMFCGSQAPFWWRLSTLALSMPWMRKSLLRWAGGQSIWETLWTFLAKGANALHSHPSAGMPPPPLPPL